MKHAHATTAQRNEIKRLGQKAFSGDIESEAFIEFSNWLQQNYMIFSLNDISFSLAPEVIEALKRKLGTASPPLQKHEPPQTPPPEPQKSPQSKKLGLGDPMLKITAKIYLKGFYEGQLFPKETPPSIDEIVKTIKEEMHIT